MSNVRRNAKSIFVVSENKSMEVRELVKEHTCSYPSQWFEANPNTKPIVQISSQNMELNLLRKCAFASNTQAVDVELINLYLSKVLVNVKGTLKDDWMSYGVMIGTKDSDITLLDLLTITTHETELQDVATAATPTEKDDLYICIFIASVCRLGRANPDVTYRNALATMILNHMKSAGFTGTLSVASAAQLHNNWLNNQSYRALIAGWICSFIVLKIIYGRSSV